MLGNPFHTSNDFRDVLLVQNSEMDVPLEKNVAT